MEGLRAMDLLRICVLIEEDEKASLVEGWNRASYTWHSS
jgi:hypothetical protein